jgi:hypothetical protein
MIATAGQRALRSNVMGKRIGETTASLASSPVSGRTHAREAAFFFTAPAGHYQRPCPSTFFTACTQPATSPPPPAKLPDMHAHVDQSLPPLLD